MHTGGRSSAAFRAEDRSFRIAVQIAPQHRSITAHRDAALEAEELAWTWC